MVIPLIPASSLTIFPPQAKPVIMNTPLIREDFEPYRNAYGLIDAKPRADNQPSGNSLLFHAHYFWMLVVRELHTSADTRATAASIKAFEVESGVYRRAPVGAPFWMDQEGPDDYIGLISMAAADRALPYARDFLFWGRNHSTPLRHALRADGRPLLERLIGWVRLKFVFNNLNPWLLAYVDRDKRLRSNWTAWLGRFPQIIAHAQFAAGERPNLFRRIAWAFSVWECGRWFDKDGTDPWILTWHLVRTFRESAQDSILCELACASYHQRLFKKWPGGLSSVFAQYFGWPHPLTKWFLS